MRGTDEKRDFPSSFFSCPSEGAKLRVPSSLVDVTSDLHQISDLLRNASLPASSRHADHAGAVGGLRGIANDRFPLTEARARAFPSRSLFAMNP